MRDLPKIALARLKASAGAQKPVGPPGGPDQPRGSEHLDPNMLAAFLEKALTQAERKQVLSHLSQCAECREIAAFTLSAEAPAVEPVRATARPRWTQWPALRWGAMAAALGAVALVLVLHPPRWKGRLETARATPPAAPGAKVTNAPIIALPPPPQSLPAGANRAPAQVTARNSAREPAAGRAAGLHRSSRLGEETARAGGTPQASFVASSHEPATVPEVRSEGEKGAAHDSLTRAASSPPARSLAAGVMATGATEAVSGAAASQAEPSRGEAPRAGPAPPVAARVTVMAAAPMAKARAVRTNIGAGPPGPLWSVSTDGAVQRSVDGGKTFHEVQVAPGVEFRTVAAIGNEVWAGGTGGVLFHSGDGGATWTRTLLSSEGNTITETIIRIQLHDPQHLTVTAASGSQWSSDDGGQAWQKQP